VVRVGLQGHRKKTYIKNKTSARVSYVSTSFLPFYENLFQNVILKVHHFNHSFQFLHNSYVELWIQKYDTKSALCGAYQ